jgi:hypothetical protein
LRISIALFARLPVFLVGAIGIAPVSDTREHQENKAWPDESATTQIPVCEIVSHFIFLAANI